MLPLSFIYTCAGLAVVLVVFVVAMRLRGLTFALAAAGLTLVGLVALFAAMVFLITWQMS